MTREVLIGLAVCGLIIAALAIVYIQTDQGTLRVESNADDVKVEIIGAGGQVKVIDVLTGSSVALSLRTGKYRVRLHGDRNDVQLSTSGFILGRGRMMLVKVTRVAQRPLAGQGAGGLPPAAITEVHRFEGHTQHVTSLAVAESGKTLYSGSADGTAAEREIQTRLNRRIIGGLRRDRPVSVATSRDGQLIAIGDWDGKIRLVRTAAAKFQEIDAGGDGLMAVAASADGSKVVSAGLDRTAKVWDSLTGKLLVTLQGHSATVCDTAFAPNGLRIVTAAFDGHLKLWDVASGQEIRTLHQLPTPHCVAWSQDGQQIAAGLRDGTVRLYDPEQLVETFRFVGHADRVQDVVFLPDSRHVISGSYDRTLRVWSIESGQEVARVQDEKHIFNALAAAPDGRHVYSAGGIWKANEETNDWTSEHDYAIRMWKLPDLSAATEVAVLEITTAERLFTGENGSGFSIAVSRDGGHALIGNLAGGVSLWDLTAASQIRRSPTTGGTVQSVHFLPDDRHAVAASLDGTIRLWNWLTNQEVRQFQGHAGRVDCLALSPDGALLLSGSADYGRDRDHSVRLWNMASGEELRQLGQAAKYYRDLSFSRDARRAYGAAAGQTSVIEWDVASGAPVHRFAATPTGPISLDVSPDGRLLASGHMARERKDNKWHDPANGAVRLWDVGSRRVVGELRGHTGPVGDVAFTPDGRFLLSLATSEHDSIERLVPSSDQTARLWDVSTGREVARYQLQERVLQIAVCPDGRSFLTVGESIRLWRIPAECWPANAEEGAGADQGKSQD